MSSRPREGNRIRLVHCIGSMEIGGAEKQLAELIQRLPRERFQQGLVLVQGGGPLVEKVRGAGCEVLSWDRPRRLRPNDPRSYPRFVLHLVRCVAFLRSRRPDVLHTYLLRANVFGALAGRLAGVPVLATSRLQLSHMRHEQPFLRWMETWTNRFASAVLANSEAVQRDILAHERLDPSKVHLIHNGVVLEQFDGVDPEPLRRELDIRAGDTVVVAVANLHPYKGLDDLVRAMARLAPESPGLRLLVAGRDGGMRAQLEGLIGEMGIEDRVALLGEREDVPALLGLADIVVHPSHTEGFSNTVLEGMAAGRPVVATDVGGTTEAVRDGREGSIVPPRDPEALALALARLIRDPELRSRMGEAGRRRAREQFSMERMVESFAAWYETLAEGSRRRCLGRT